MFRKIFAILTLTLGILIGNLASAKDVHIGTIQNNSIDCYVNVQGINRNSEPLNIRAKDVENTTTASVNLVYRSNSKNQRLILYFTRFKNGTVNYDAQRFVSNRFESLPHDEMLKELAQKVWDFIKTEPDIVPKKDVWILDWNGKSIYLKARSFELAEANARGADQNQLAFKCTLVYDDNDHEFYFCASSNGRAYVFSKGNHVGYSSFYDSIYAEVCKQWRTWYGGA